MHGVRDLQAELVQSLKRQDRSELVVQSTQALNDTFRNLATIQRELLSRLDTSPKQGRTGRLVPLMMLGLLLVFLGGTYVILDVLEQMKSERSEFVENAREATATTLAAFREGKDEALQEVEEREARLQDELERREARLQAVQEQLETEAREKARLEAEKGSLQAERDTYAGQVRAAESEVLARRAVEEELTDVTTRLAVVEPRMRDLQHDLDRERAETARLRERLGAIGLGRPDPAAEQTPADAAPEAPVPPPRVSEPPVEQDPRLIEKIRDRLNRMLEDGAAAQGALWQVTRIDGVSADRLAGVIALRYDRGTGRLLEQVEARDLQIWVDRNNRAVDFEFREGRRTDGGPYQIFPGGVLTQRVATGELFRVWSGSGMAFLRYR